MALQPGDSVDLDTYDYAADVLTMPAVKRKLMLEALSNRMNGDDRNAVTAETGTTAEEFGDPYNRITVLTVSTTLPAIAGGAELGVGKLLATLPAGRLIVKSCTMSLAITQSDGNITNDTPDVGIGTTIASGAVALLGGTAAFENLVTGQAAGDCDGAVTTGGDIPTAGIPLVIAAGGDHTVYANVADDWAASGDAAAALAGTVVLHWSPASPT